MVERRRDGSQDTVVFGIRWDGGRRPRTRGRLTSLLALLAAVLVPAAAAQAAPIDPAQPLREAVVVPAPGHGADARALIARLGGRAGTPLALIHGFAARVPAGSLASLAASPAVRTAVPDAALSTRSDDDGTAAADTSMGVVRSTTGAGVLQSVGINGAGIGVAVVDSGVMTLPGLDSGQVVRGPDFSSEGDDPAHRGLDTFGHGTHLAGVIAGRKGNFKGVAPGSHVVSVKVADANGSTSLVRVLLGLDWVREHQDDPGMNIRVVNLSLGVDASAASYVREPLAYAAEELWRSGLVVVAAAGNNGSDTARLDVPAADPFIVAVGAVDTGGTAAPGDDTVASFSSRGDGVRNPDVLAPGTSIVSLRVPGGSLDMQFPGARVGSRYFRGSGTSQATAVVSGLVALMLQVKPDLSPDQVKALLIAAGRDLGAPARAEGHGSVDLVRLRTATVPAAASVRQAFKAATFDEDPGDDGPGPADGGPAGHGGPPGPAGGPVDEAMDNARWNGRTWSGRTWSGRTWSGRTWSGRTWSGGSWDGGDAAP
jgi:serine protease AprX